MLSFFQHTKNNCNINLCKMLQCQLFEEDEKWNLKPQRRRKISLQIWQVEPTRLCHLPSEKILVMERSKEFLQTAIGMSVCLFTTWIFFNLSNSLHFVLSLQSNQVLMYLLKYYLVYVITSMSVGFYFGKIDWGRSCQNYLLWFFTSKSISICFLLQSDYDN